MSRARLIPHLLVGARAARCSGKDAPDPGASATAGPGPGPDGAPAFDRPGR
jgi:hypothetical protein